ncbi:uncharacterized protein PODANS_2_1350 [Podospora anserina S mat+]|uniref:Podospora anserina S mat+ genomic DNA chromosome 2, supercontig 2 n=1 Tax=Podospora anserina (strain S / ATCC MYA-4624 / DSM 980 / FGSC 10383) TaxID=515849 RepID=B2B4H9_PODAN|nr:uncharacterized protein PODANS_2_1350 [Podospora anserina S mat+]CAP72704.1 unnamed protein product [Podospora anserina S mat+]
MRLEWITVSKQPTHSSAGQGPLLMRPSSTNVLNTPIPPLNASIPCVAVAGWLGLLIFLPLNPYTNTSTQQTPFFLSLSLPPTWHTGTQQDLRRRLDQTAIRYRPRQTMAGVEGVAFVTGGLPLAGNKQSGSFYSHDMDEAGSTDFFDQFVMFDGSDSETTAEGGGGLGQFCGASGLPMSPQLSSIEPSLSMPIAAETGGGGAAGTHGNFGPPGAIHGNVNGHSLPAGGWQGAVNSPIIARPRQFHQQQAQRLQRSTTNIGDLKIKPDTEVDGLPYTTSGFGEALGGGTVSDSELLKLEGLSMRATKVEVPQPAASVPPSPTPLASSPKKTSRLGAFCSRFRSKAASTLQGKSKQQQMEIKQESISTPVISSAQMGGGAAKPRPGRPRPVNLDLTKSQLPLSPPLTGAVPTSSQPQTISGDQLMNGSNNNKKKRKGRQTRAYHHPWLTPKVSTHPKVPPPLPINNNTNNIPQTPLQTPLSHTIPPEAKRKRKYPGGVFAPKGEINTNGGDTTGIDAMDTDPITNLFPPTTSSTTTNPRDASLNLAMHFPPNSFEYPLPPGAEDFSVSQNLMLHMPQPRGPNSAVLHPQYRAQMQQQQSSSSSSSRRPKPRAPSSGARHHHYTTSGPGMSPRKTRTVASGSSTTPSPTTTTTTTSSKPIPPGGRSHRRSTSMTALPSGTLLDPPSTSQSSSAAIRKRRSWTGRRVSHSSSQINLHSLASPSQSSRGHKSTRRTASCSSLAALAGMGGVEHNGGGGGGGSFVNYTPNDKQLLMTGVAPSGSSKTKLRREKEAKEKAREFKERLARAVEAAGGDLKRLEEVEEGLALGV